MPVAIDQLRDRPKRLRKSLKKLPKDSSVPQVHQLRTRSRKLEAMFHALGFDSRKNERRLLKAIKPVRQRAGKVRDMDVLTQYAALPKIRGEEECSVRLLEYLGAQRRRKERKLRKAASNQSSEIQRRLKQSSSFLDKTIRNDAEVDQWSSEAAALALQLESELRSWPKLSRNNLHPFRLKVKNLLYVLQMAENPDDDFVDMLDGVKDEIGEWHDWEELAGIAKHVLQHAGCKLTREIRTTAQKRFENALAAANQFRQQQLGLTQATHRRSTRPALKQQAALRSVATLAA